MEFMIMVLVITNIILTGFVVSFLIPLLPKKTKEKNIVVNLPMKKRSPIMVDEVAAEKRNKNGTVIEL